MWCCHRGPAIGYVTFVAICLCGFYRGAGCRDTEGLCNAIPIGLARFGIGVITGDNREPAVHQFGREVGHTPPKCPLAHSGHCLLQK